MNCDDKRSKIGAGYELVLSEKSSITNSPKKFTVNADDFQKTSCVNELNKFEMIAKILLPMLATKLQLKEKRYRLRMLRQIR